MSKRIVREVITFLPLSDRVLVLADPGKTQTDSGIIIPETAVTKEVKGYVVAIGPGKIGEAMQLKVGDHISYSQYSGTEIDHNGVSYLIMRDTDVNGLLAELDDDTEFQIEDVWKAALEKETPEEKVKDAGVIQYGGGRTIVPSGKDFMRRDKDNKSLPGRFDSVATAVTAFKKSENAILEAQAQANKHNAGVITEQILKDVYDNGGKADTATMSIVVNEAEKLAGLDMFDGIKDVPEDEGLIIAEEQAYESPIIDEPKTLVAEDFDNVKQMGRFTDNDYDEDVVDTDGEFTIIRLTKEFAGPKATDQFYQIVENNVVRQGEFANVNLAKMSTKFPTEAVAYVQSKIPAHARINEDTFVELIAEWQSLPDGTE